MKWELCKFYLNDCCAKGDKCLYMHSDFPCKFYHTGQICLEGDNCKFAHGPALSDSKYFSHEVTWQCFPEVFCPLLLFLTVYISFFMPVFLTVFHVLLGLSLPLFAQRHFQICL